MELKEKIKQMTPEEVEENTFSALEKAEKGQIFYAGVITALNITGIVPEEFANECRTNA